MKALIIAGSCPQIVLLGQLKQRGIFTILADNNPNAVARPYADEFVKVDLLNIDAVKQVAIEKKVDFLIAVCADQVLLTVAKISEDLGLPCYLDYDTTCKISNKGYMKNVFQQFDIPSSKHVFMSELDESKIAELQYPLVVKPVDAYSSKGVRKVTNHDELIQFFNEASKISRSGVVIVEEFVEGAELTVDFEIVDGKAHFLCASNTEKVNYCDRFLAFRTRYPAAVSPATIDRIKVIGQKIADAFELKDTPMLIQLLTDDKRESVLEFSARTGGGAKYLLLKMATGFDPITAVIDLTLGKKPQVGEIKSESKLITNEFLYGNKGFFDHLEGFEEMKQQGVIKEYWQFKWKGAEIVSASTSSDRIASITIQANSYEELVEKHNTAARNIRIIDTNGNDIMRHDLLTDIKPLNNNIFYKSL
jgi:biotin carboxylase